MRRALNLTDQSRSGQRLAPAGRRGPVPATQGMTGTENDINGKLEAMMRRLDQIYGEVRSLRREQLPATPTILEELFTAIHSVLGDKPFTAQEVLYQSTFATEQADRLDAAIRQAVGTRSTKALLSRFLKKSLGVLGPWRLLLHRDHSNDGKSFRVITNT